MKVVMIVQITLIHSLIRVLRMFDVSGTADTKMIQIETLKSIWYNREMCQINGRN